MAELWVWIESTELAFQIGATWWFPLLESIHVLGLALLLGSIVMLDLRLLGISAQCYQPEEMASGMLCWAWLGFVLAIVTGLGMFISRPSAYAANPAFQIKLLLLLVCRDIAECHENRITGMVMCFIKILQLLVCQVRNIYRLTTTVVVIGCCRIKMFTHCLPQHTDRRTHRAFHFIEHHTLEFKLAVRIIRLLEFNTMSLLQEIEFIQPGEKCRIQIDIQKIVEVFSVLAGKRVCGPVTTGECIHESIQ